MLQRAKEDNIRFKKPKCKFLDSVEFLGHIIDKDGIYATPEKVNAVVNAPQPKDVSELRAFLGLLNYYGKFLPNLAGKLHPLNSLLKKQDRWVWSDACEKAFVGAKQALVSAEVLVHYNPELPILVAADASSYSIGAVLSHILPDGSEHPISFASRTLSASEKNYSQRKFSLVTDHKPLLAILGSKKGIPPLAAAHMQRWSFLLQQIAEILQQKSLISKTTVDLNTKLCGSLKRELCKVWFCCSRCLLQDFCNLLYQLTPMTSNLNPPHCTAMQMGCQGYHSNKPQLKRPQRSPFLILGR